MLLIESDLNWSYSIILMEIFGKKFWGLITPLLCKKEDKNSFPSSFFLVFPPEKAPKALYLKK